MVSDEYPGAGRRIADLARPVVWCRPTDSVREVAGRISAGRHSYALVRTATGLGIVTDHDFRRRVATGEVGVDAPIEELVSVPAFTVAAAASPADGLLRMVEHAVHHLVITDAANRPVGVLRAVDLAQSEVRDPLRIRSAVADAESLAELAEAAALLPAAIVDLHDNRVDPLHIGALQAAVVTAIVRRLLQLRPDPVLTGVRHSWLVLGSLARREPLPLSDLDSALVWEDLPAGAAGNAALGSVPPGSVPPGAGSAGPEPPGSALLGPKPDAVRAAAGRVIADLSRIGQVPCPSGTNADNPRFSRSRAEWLAAGRRWQEHPGHDQGLLMVAMLADSRPVTEPGLGRTVTEPLRNRRGGSRFVRSLLEETLRFRPPTGFVRDFVVEHSGEHRGQLDLKKGGLAPVVSLARWAAVVAGEPEGSTAERLRRGAERGLLTADEAQTLTGAYADIYRLVLGHEAEALRSGAAPTTYLAPREVDTLTRRHLRESFRAIRAVQARIDEHWLARLERADLDG